MVNIYRNLFRRLAFRSAMAMACLVWLEAWDCGAERARSAENWRRISVFIRDTLVRKHPDLYFKLPQADYERMTGALLADLPRLSDRQTAADYFGPGDAALEAALAYDPTAAPLK